MTSDPAPKLTLEQRRRAETLFHQAAQLQFGQRDTLLDVQCPDDPLVRAEVENLLHHHDAATRNAGEPRNTPDAAPSDSAPVDAADWTEDLSGQWIGSYQLLGLIGEGGFGDVYLAEQEQPVRRRVALKVIRAGMDTREVVRRFEAERQALAVMDHPFVAKVFDGGATPKGRPYFVMEYVAGESITHYCDRNKLGMPERLELLIGVCQAVQHAHQKGIIHRDIKPSNVLVSVKEGKATPKVIDFGVAKATNQRLTEQTIYTKQGLQIGTPEYMSPEQAEMGATDVDSRTDIYSLGVLLYELLTGSLPFDSQNLRRAGYAEIQRIIREVDPPRPSTKLLSLRHAGREPVAAGVPAGRGSNEADDATVKSGPPDRGPTKATSAAEVAARRRTDAKTLLRQLRRDLDWIVMKCIEKDRTRRYETANALAIEIKRFLDSEPVLAGPPSAAYRARKFIRRNRTGVIAAGVVTAALLAATVVSIAFGQSEARQRASAERTADFMAFMLEGVTASVALGRDTTMLREMLDSVAKRIDDGELKDSPEAELRLRWTIGGAYRDIAEGGANERAEKFFLPTLELAERTYGAESEQMAFSLNGLSLCLQSLGRPSEALPKHEAALAIRQRRFKGDHRDVAASLNNVAACLESLGRLGEALPSFEAALEMRQRLCNGDDPEVATCLDNVAYCLVSVGRSSEALPKHEAALEIRQRLFKGDHPDVATSLNNVAYCLQSFGRSSEALPKYEAALEMQQQLFKSDHPDVAITLSNMAKCLQSLGRSSDALAKCEAALEMSLRLFKGDNLDVAFTLNSLAFCLLSLGRSSEALPKFEAALEMHRKCLPLSHSRVLYPQIGLAKTLVNLKRFEEAEPLLLDAFVQCERSPQTNRLHWRIVLATSVQLYDDWHAAEPDKGYDKKAAEWRAKLAEWQATTQPATTQPASSPATSLQ